MNTRTVTIAAIALAIWWPSGGEARAEDFDQPGVLWTSTIFPVLHPSGGGTFSREILTVAQGAPNTSPALPINALGDKEGRYFEIGIAGSSSYALMAGIPENHVADSEIDGYVAIGYPDTFGSRSVAFLLRSSAPPINAYAAIMNHNSGTTATLSLVRIRNGVVGVGDVFVTSDSFSVDLAQENYRILLSAQGTSLSASLWRVAESGGAVVESPIDLDGAPGVQNTLTGPDGALIDGRAGVQAFARGLNSIFWDDVLVRVGDCDRRVDFETEYIGTNYGAAAGDAPGDVIFEQDGIPVSVEQFQFVGGGGAFVLAEIQYAFSGFGFNYTMGQNNINLGFDLTGIGCVGRVDFEFADLGGFENIQVNGASLFAGELSAAPAAIAPGVTLSVTTTPIPGGQRGTATLTGPVSRFKVGGQEFWLDSVCVLQNAPSCDGDSDGNCTVDFQDLLAVLAAWSPGSGSCIGCPADVDGDGDVDFQDLLLVLANWGPCPP